MGLPVSVNDLMRVSYICQAGPQVGVNVRFYRCVAKGDNGMDYDQLAEAISLVVGPKYIALLNTSASYWGLRIVPKWSIPQMWATSTSNAAQGTGTASGAPMPYQTCGMFTCTTPLAGRKYRGRCYVPFPAGDDNEYALGYSRPTAGYMTRLGLLASYHVGQEVFEKTGTPTDTVTLDPVLWHEATNDTTLIQGATARQKWATQRRRSAYGQTNNP